MTIDTLSGVTRLSAGGDPVQARVSVLRTDDNTIVASALSDAITGAFEFTEVGSGTFELLTLVAGRQAYMDGPWILIGTLALTGTLAAATEGEAYSSGLSLAGGTGPFSWSISVGTLPAGLTINSSTGVISGTPTETGSFAVTVRVEDSGDPPQQVTSEQTLEVAGSADPFAEHVVGLFHCNGTNLSTSIPDSAGYAWTRVGSAALSTSFKLFGTASMLNGGPGGAHGLLSPSGAEWTFGTNDFCVEFWYRPSSLSGGLILFDMRSGAANNGLAIYTSGASLRVYANGADRITGPNLSIGTAVRIAVARVDGVTRLFVNGAQSGSSYTDGNDYTATRCSIGYQYYNNAGASAGYYDEIRVTNGAGRHDDAYTLATEEFPDP